MSLMQSINYKVLFKGESEEQGKNLSLTFKSISFNPPLNIKSQILLEIKRLSEKSQTIVSFQNIEEVVKIGRDPSNTVYNYYIILLFTLKATDKRSGLLLGNVKNLGDLIIGIWPFNEEVQELTPETINSTLEDLVKNPNQYTNICLIN